VPSHPFVFESGVSGIKDAKLSLRKIAQIGVSTFFGEYLISGTFQDPNDSDFTRDYA